MRPARWGKSSLIEMLVRYYDAHRATTYDEWKPWFDGLDIYENPTPSKPHFSIDEIEVLLTHVLFRTEHITCSASCLPSPTLHLRHSVHRPCLQRRDWG